MPALILQTVQPKVSHNKIGMLTQEPNTGYKMSWQTTGLADEEVTTDACMVFGGVRISVGSLQFDVLPCFFHNIYAEIVNTIHLILMFLIWM